MKQHYTLSDSARLLAVSRTTLWRWLSHAGIEPRRQAIDSRRLVLTGAQLGRLARMHGRLIVGMDVEMLARIAALEMRVAQLEQRHKAPGP